MKTDYMTAGEVIAAAPFPLNYMRLRRMRFAGTGPKWIVINTWALYDAESVRAWFEETLNPQLVSA